MKQKYLDVWKRGINPQVRADDIIGNAQNMAPGYNRDGRKMKNHVHVRTEMLKDYELRHDRDRGWNDTIHVNVIWNP